MSLIKEMTTHITERGRTYAVVTHRERERPKWYRYSIFDIASDGQRGRVLLSASCKISSIPNVIGHARSQLTAYLDRRNKGSVAECSGLYDDGCDGNAKACTFDYGGCGLLGCPSERDRALRLEQAADNLTRTAKSCSRVARVTAHHTMSGAALLSHDLASIDLVVSVGDTAIGIRAAPDGVRIFASGLECLDVSPESANTVIVKRRKH